jgi:diguanylate cyclase (GGDEF)-like protein
MVNTGLQQILGMNPESMSSVIDLIPAPVFVLDSSGLLSDSNHAFRKLFHLKESAHGQQILEIFPPPLPSLVQETADKSAKGEMVAFETEIEQPHSGLSSIRAQQCGFFDKDGEYAGSVGLVFDLTEEAKRFDRLRQLSIIDELTALPNRRHGLERVQNLLQQSKRNEFSFSFMILDIDSFKEINDYEGHQAGDVVLQEIAEIIRELCRSYDLAFRYGGDEFIICLPNTGSEAAAAFAERIRGAVEAHQFLLQDSTRVSSTVTIGIADFPGDGDNMETLLAAADAALYRAKQNGRNRIESASTTKIHPAL